MIEMKKKAIGGIKSMLEGRLAGRMRPQPDKEDAMEGPETGPPDAEDLAEGPEAPPSAEPPTADLPGVEKLTPEEIEQLKALLAKLG
jgi:hypothetical protein